MVSLTGAFETQTLALTNPDLVSFFEGGLSMKEWAIEPTSIQEEKKSHIILYGANIGEHHSQVSWEKAANAMVPIFYPAENRAIELSLKNSSFHDNNKDYWLIERQHLKSQFLQYIKPRLASGEVNHFSIFGLAPIPLLIKLGYLLSDIPKAEVYQLHREPPDWKWQSHPDHFQYKIAEPDSRHSTVAINMSLSATIDHSRIADVLKEPHSVWTMSVVIPNNDFLKSRSQLRQFRSCFRALLDRIKTEHGESSILHIFPAIPVSIAVEIGRVWMPKADLPMMIYDQNRNLGGFVPAFSVPSLVEIPSPPCKASVCSFLTNTLLPCSYVKIHDR